MAKKSETIYVNVDSNIKSVTKDTDKMADSLEDVNKEAKDSIGNFTYMGLSLNGVKSAFGKVIPMAKAMFGTIRAGIMSTGIGALVIAVTSLITYFTQTKRGADKLAVGFAGIGAALDVVTDRISRIGEIISLVFEGKFRAAGKLAKEIFSGMTEEIKKETEAMMALKKRTQELRDADMEFMVQKAKTRQEIERARLIAEDETKSAQERLDNLKKALELEEKTTKKELELARERMLIQQEEMSHSENLVEDEEKLAQLKTELIEKETASIKMRRRVVTEVNSLEREIAAEKAARVKSEKLDAMALTEFNLTRIKDETDAEFQIRINAAKETAKQEVAEAKKAADAKIAEDKRVADEKIAITKAVNDFEKATVQKTFGALAAVAGENAALSKAVAAAQTIYQTQQGIMAAMGATSVGDKLLPYPLRVANAIATGVMGAAALSKILSTNPTSGGGGGGGGVPTAGAATPAPTMMSGAFELTGGEKPEPVQAFVVSDEITKSQNSLEIIRRRATI